MVNYFRAHLLGSFAVMALLSVTAIVVPAKAQMKDAAQHPLPWAYAVFDAPPPAPPVTDDGKLYHIPGSDQGFTMKQLKDSGNVFDWFPSDHPTMPPIVVHRRSPGVTPWIGSCGWCHLTNGKGRPENAGIAGLPVDYILMQLDDFKNGARKTGDPGKKNTVVMSGNAAGMTGRSQSRSRVLLLDQNDFVD